MKEELNRYLLQIRRKYDNDRRITYSHAKHRYELEVPVEHVKGNKKPSNFEFTSQRKGFERFHTAEIKEMVDKLEDAEHELKDAILPFLSAIFRRFHDLKDMWTQLIGLLTEVDCLLSLAVASSQSEGHMCLPELIPYEGEYAETALFDVKDLRHPCVQMPNGRQFIPNDTYISPSEGQGLLLVTGPNMGGKSTILRQNCLATVLA